ncbi:methylated-DNA--[protein]-cysteine S-methyltransferase [Kocuria sp.]|uniref:methylated-DNA--[protein]-cysteine S-methyltransferase n=1 Tax=Kocuria sp. TaxID=1871328 RepID=UPI0026E06E35|nr:methylated-DNA--[protein]-cysteine S-methyltransferase [Kocuria sp.]MDO5618252.1 methylated-DNA--[protein]-cysteine S-methyltransferase [Kocuria sp.]
MTNPTQQDFVTDLETQLNASGDDVARLRSQLAATAQKDGLLDVAFRELDSPLGTLLVATTERGVVKVGFESQGFDSLLSELAQRVSPRILSAPARLDNAARQLDEYFRGERREFELELDHQLSRGFRDHVQRQLPRIAYGHTVSYAHLAELAGNARAVRAVASACATNPLPIVVPCHRVVRTDGSLGGYLGGLEAKESLLALERNGSRN